MVRPAKRDLLESRDSMDPLVPRAIRDLRGRKAKQERRGEPACLGGLARAAPWGLSGRQVLRGREATLGLRGRPGALDCPGCPAPWETW